MYYATSKEMERLDMLAVRNGLEIRQMMELAGWHMLTLFRTLKISHKARVVVVVGKGNKGGDGLSCARHLYNHGWNVSVVLLSKNISSDAKHHLQLLKKMGVKLLYWKDSLRVKKYISESDIIIDALIGYHLRGAPNASFAKAIEVMNAADAKIISYDIPTGVVATTGECFSPCVKAYATLTLALPKKAFLLSSAKQASGRVFLADIGIPEFLYNKIARKSRPFLKNRSNSLIRI